MAKLVLLAAMALLLAVPIAGASSITRSFSKDAYLPGEAVPVTLDVSITGGETYYLVDEMVPSGWVISEKGTGDTTDSGHLKWAIIQNAASTSYSYSAVAPESEGSYSFSGEYMFEGMMTKGTTGGSQVITVRAPLVKPGYETLIVPIIILGSLLISAAIYMVRFQKGKAGKKHAR